MIDLARIEGFDWDTGNQRKSADKHGVSQAEAEQVFFNSPLLFLEDVRPAMIEPRFHALGRTDDGRQLHITFTLREENRLIRVISARGMHRSERTRYAQET
ncbi:MAG: BrnT family toxin [Alphaproteobacteria bacterium]|nr:BrnT family toxin [Alphaproteobacteria bacterium]